MTDKLRAEAGTAPTAASPKDPAEESPAPLHSKLKQGPSEGGIIAPKWVVAIDPSNARSGLFVYKDKKAILSAEFCPWLPEQVESIELALCELRIATEDPNDVLILCEVSGHGAHFSRAAVNRAAGLCMMIVLRCITTTRDLRKRVAWIVPVSWRKRVYGTVLRGVEKKQWKTLAIMRCLFLLGQRLGEDAAEAALLGFAYIDGYDFANRCGTKLPEYKEPKPPRVPKKKVVDPNIPKRPRGRPRKNPLPESVVT